MPPVQLFQTSFNRGELDPALAGRWDWQSYFSGARLERNMVCRPQGGAIKRAGTELVAESLDPEKPSTFVRFQFAVTQVYMLEFSDYRFRVLMDGGVVHYPSGHALANQEVILESPYSADQMAKVRVAQTEDVMIFTHPDHQPRSLTRKDHHIWEFETLSFGASINPPEGIRLDRDGRRGHRYVVSAVTAGNDESLPGETVTCTNASGSGIPVPDYSALNTAQCRELWVNQYAQTWPPQWDIWNTPIGSAHDFFIRQQMGYQLTNYGNTVTFRRPNGVKREANRSDKAAFVDEYCYACDMGWNTVLATMRAEIEKFVTEYNLEHTGDGYNILSWNAVPDAARYRVYRELQTSEGSRFLLLAVVTATTFEDDSLALIGTETPQTSQEPFIGPDNYPGVCAFYDQRLILARTNNKPMTVWGSRIGSWRNFNTNDPGEDEENPQNTISDSSAFEHTFYADDVNEILWCKSMSDLLFGTAGGEFRMGGAGYTITPTNVSASRQSNYGCSDIRPELVGQAVIGVGRRNRVLRAYSWNDSKAAYKGDSISHCAGHLFEGRSMVSIAYQSEPDSILWAVMSDGALLSLTYMAEEEVLGWSRHDTDGKFEAVAAMKDIQGNDEIWFIVARVINGVTRRFIERMKEISYVSDAIEDAWYVDCGLSRNGAETDSLSGLSHLEGKNVVCLGDGHVYRDLTVKDGAITLPRKVRKATVGLPYEAELETVELEPQSGESIAHMAKTKTMASVLFYGSRECWYGMKERPLPLNFRTEEPDRPIKPKTIRKNMLVPNPVGDNRAFLWLMSKDPVPFGVLSVAIIVNVGTASPGPGRAINAA